MYIYIYAYKYRICMYMPNTNTKNHIPGMSQWGCYNSLKYSMWGYGMKCVGDIVLAGNCQNSSLFTTENSAFGYLGTPSLEPPKLESLDAVLRFSSKTWQLRTRRNPFSSPRSGCLVCCARFRAGKHILNQGAQLSSNKSPALLATAM